MDTHTLIMTETLAEWLDRPDLVVLDASWHMPTEQRDAQGEYRTAHIPGAVFFDLEATCDAGAVLPHMLPPPEVFARQVGQLGIRKEDQLVIYDSKGLFSAPRVWWMFKAYGHEKVAVLDGGLPQWQREGRPVEPGDTATVSVDYPVPVLNASRYAAMADVQQASTTGMLPVLDARSPARFQGEEPDPRPGVRSGHIPGSANLHYKTLLREDGSMQSPEALDTIFREQGVEPEDPFIASCGSGVTACVLALAAARLGNEAVRVYDGSWAEWGKEPG